MGEGAEFQDTGYFLTSYAEFDYARRAIQLESVEYLLKPIDFEKLEEALKKAEDAIVIDSSNLSIDEVVKKIEDIIKEHK